MDPQLCKAIFHGLRYNFCLQELILSNDALAHCNSFEVFFESLAFNKYSALTLIDFSDNYNTIDDDFEWHENFIEAILNQERSSLSNHRDDITSNNQNCTKPPVLAGIEEENENAAKEHPTEE